MSCRRQAGEDCREQNNEFRIKELSHLGFGQKTKQEPQRNRRKSGKMQQAEKSTPRKEVVDPLDPLEVVIQEAALGW